MSRRRKSFTMVEILLVTALFASIALAVFTCLANGLKLWDRTRSLVEEEDAALFLDKFSTDIANSFAFSTLDWQGGEYELSFPTIVWTRADVGSSRADEGYVDQIGRVRYIFDVAEKTVLRQQANYSQALHAQWSDPQVMASGIEEVRFKYYTGTSEYQTQLPEGGRGVRGIEVELRSGGWETGKMIKRLVALPSGV